MSKAFLILDMPSSCKDCPLRVSLDETFCIKTLKDITDKEYFECKPNWCPLRELPKMKPTIGKEIDNDILCMNAGYNACIDELLKGEEG